MCKEYENVQMKKIKKNMKLNKFELIRFALRAESTIFPNGRLDCINGNFQKNSWNITRLHMRSKHVAVNISIQLGGKEHV